MSVSIAVFFDEAKMPTPSEWDAAMRALGFATRLDTDFDPHTFEGYLPCAYEGTDAGFEYQRMSSSAMLDESEATATERARVGNRNTALRFDTHSRMRDLMASTLASASLCAITGGVVWDLEANEWFGADEILAWANRQKASITPHLD